ncbi:MBL fold metallo-hydrolase [Nakamurella leprariae]|uniref:MBL fold metallo-hydrolase n=1 Tax=Nakamurella leprariae TaxID=2803911 RepID=A0A938YEU9_9ACTN|nr:MBL fold metallo-hydrolase [Nakamurella leprariae]MBM9466550.1 MBL fold metallo-hydrolase [Nakamurella leprariae]
MQQLTDNVWTDTTLKGCNPSLVRTAGGVVVVDTPQLPTHAVELRRRAEALGPIRFIVNTEHHVDHIFGNWWFRGAGEVVLHQGVYDNFMEVRPGLDSYEFALESVHTHDPAALAHFPDRETYFADPNKGSIVLTGDATLHVGDHTFELLHTPGHTPGQLAVVVPQERVVFTGDTIFSECRTWLMTSDLDGWLVALDRIAALDVDVVVPGHGPVTTLGAVAAQRAVLLAWMHAAADAVARGWSRQETIDRLADLDRSPVDVGLESMEPYIRTANAGSLWDRYTAAQPEPARS